MSRRGSPLKINRIRIWMECRLVRYYASRSPGAQVAVAQAHLAAVNPTRGQLEVTSDRATLSYTLAVSYKSRDPSLGNRLRHDFEQQQGKDWKSAHNLHDGPC